LVAPNDILGSYRLIERIGAGGMGEVWKAEDTKLGRIVAVKILPSAVAADHEATARMRREARTAAQHNHPNIATIHSFEEIGDRLFIVMEYVEGEPLTKLIALGPIAEADVCRIGRGVADALAEAHSKGIIHRDIKPDNIIVNGNRVKVLDFGIAKHVGVKSGANDPTAFMTQQGMIVGTVHYMSPEQALGKSLDTRTDIFSLGVVLYQAATGRLPFSGDSVTETITRIVRDEPQSPSRVNPAVSKELTSIITRCLRKNRIERYATGGDLGSALEIQMTRATTAPMKTAVGAPPTVVEKPTRKRVLIPAILGAATVALAIGLIFRPRSDRPLVAAPTTRVEPSPTAAMVKPDESDAPAHLNLGLLALSARKTDIARDEFRRALENGDHLSARERGLAELGMAVANGNRVRARQLAERLWADHPDDPEVDKLRQMLRNEERPRRGRRRP
jgi:eukaryotic-like serine/threonine-protein kinase